MSSSLLRPPTEADAEAIAALFTAAYGDWRPMDAEEVRSWLRDQRLPAENTRVLEAGGVVAGYGDMQIDADVELDVAAPGHWEVFLDWAEERARDSGVRRVRAFFPEGHELERVLAAYGFRFWRASFVMRIELDERPAAAPLPEGLELRPYRDEDAEALRLALNEAFCEEAFWHPIPDGSYPFLQARGADASLWPLAWDGDELAGFAVVVPRRGSDDTTGWVNTLGVRSGWRRRGLGEALLRTAFLRLYDRGLRRVGLGVDSENPTGALGLYERSGMRRVLRQDNWVKDL